MIICFFQFPSHLDDLGQNRRILHNLVKRKRKIRVQVDVLALHLFPRIFKKLLKLSLLLKLQQTLALTVMGLGIITINGKLAQKVALKREDV